MNSRRVARRLARSRGVVLLPSVRGELLSRLGCSGEAAAEFDRAAAMATNGVEKGVLAGKAAHARTLG